MPKPCKDFLRGNCRFGSKCKFAHEQEVCHNFQRGRCKFGGACERLHDDTPQQHAPPAPKPLSELLAKPINTTFTQEAPEITRRLTQDADDNGMLLALSQSIWFASLKEQCGAVSFQGVVLPLLQFCTRSAVVNSPHRDKAQWFFTVLHEPNLSVESDYPVFQSKIIFTLQDCINNNNFQDRSSALIQRQRWNDGDNNNKMSEDQVVTTITLFFAQIFQRFSKDVGHEFYSKVLDILNEAVARYVPNMLSAVEKMERIRKEHAWTGVSTALQRQASIPVFVSVPPTGGPGQLHLAKPRHDNDHVDFTAINIIPTVHELTSDMAEYLPDNRTLAYHHLAHDKDASLHLAPTLSERFPRIDDARLLDLHFRLFRADFVLALKQTLGEIRTNHKFRLARNQALDVMSMLAVPMERNAPMAVGFKVEIRTPPQMTRATWAEKHRKWFNVGSLVAFEIKNQIHVLAQVVGRQGLVDPKSVSPWFCVCGLLDTEKSLLMDLAANNGRLRDVQIRHVVDEFFVYRPVLAALQNCQQLPFSGLLSATSGSVVECNRPAYVSSQDTFDLSCLRKSTLQPGVNDPLRRFPGTLSNLASQYATELKVDADQLEAIVKTLSNEVSLIQGPPGTGKSYCGSLLVHILLNSFPKTIGPILCLCTTNHALDQFVMDVLEIKAPGKTLRVVRLGGRSKNPDMEAYSLFKQLEAQKTRGGSNSCNAAYHEFKNLKRGIELFENKQEMRWNDLSEYIALNLPRLYKEINPLCDEEEEAWKKVESNKSKRNKDPLHAWVYKGRFASGSKEFIGPNRHVHFLNSLPFNDLDTKQRDRLVEVIKAKALSECFVQFEDAHGNAVKSQDVEHLAVLRHANLVAATTSKAAEVQNLIRALKPKVIIIEEAGEVFEAHTLAALDQGTEHLILIGDHQQLRPKPQHYPLSLPSGNGINLDVSMFERLVKEKRAPMTLLNEQRRMRPEIADFTRLTYPKLLDSGRVTSYPNVRGTVQNVCFIHHQNREDGKGDDDRNLTKSNTWEASFVAQFALYLLQQGYAKGEIAIIVPYTGQLSKVRSELRKLRYDLFIEVNEQDERELELLGEDNDSSSNNPTIEQTTIADSVRIATVDNFQGEEADVILFSTVRNNNAGSIGFLNDDNRINVALSRARHGMFVFGNLKLLEAKSELWNKVIALARSKNLVTESVLELQCANHSDKITPITKPSDFKLVSDGGCDLLCTVRLDCGHACPLHCHSSEHGRVKCLASCDRRCVRGHECKLMCYETCACKERVADMVLPCGHSTVGLRCHEVDGLDRYSCKARIVTLLKCDHNVEHQCGANNVPPCKELCLAELACGHRCQNLHIKCEEDGYLHRCIRKCSKPQSCSHECELYCGHDGPCPDCIKPCNTQCAHSNCNKKCHEFCAPCMQPHGCAWQCEHHKCELPCGVPCERGLCNEPCTKLLLCGHACPSLCGEVCPPPAMGCRICAEPKWKQACADLIMLRTLEDLEEHERTITLVCGHTFTVETLDGHFSMTTFYDEEHGAPLTGEIKFGEIKYCKCPSCRALVAAPRYSRLLKRAETETMSIRFQAMVRKQNDVFYANAAGICEVDVEGNNSIAKKRRHEIKELVKSMNKFRKSMRDPLRVVAEAVNAPVHADTSWERMQAFIEFAVQWERKDSTTGVRYVTQEFLAKETSELVAVHCTALALRALNTWKASNDARTLMEGFVARFPEPQTKDAIEMKQECESALSTTTREFQLELIRLASLDLAGRQGWYGNGHVMQCPNGHFYVIGNCGGAMVVSRCLECGATIGGQNHRLAMGNSVVMQ